jgi:tetratricopeptide (TPR) repeat protein
MIMAGKLSRMQRVVPEEKDFAAWLHAEYSNCRDLASWILHQKPEIAASDEDLRTLLTSLRRRENDDPEWASFWLRNQHHTIRTFTHYHLARFSQYFTIQAMRSIGAAEQAQNALEQYLSAEGESPVMWLLMAECAIDLDKYGIAVHAIERASEHPQTSGMMLLCSDCAFEPSRWNRAVLYVQHRLGRSALARAMRNPVVEPALLELAIKYGDAQTISEAALCWFDAALPDSDTPAAALAESPKARECWILAISRRRDISHLDRLYDFYLKLALLAPDNPEVAYIEALCQIDNPSAAVQTIGRVERKLNANTVLLCDALSLHTELLAEMQAYDEAMNILIPYLASDALPTRRILVGLMARMPREALPMLQTMMCEQLGRDRTLSIFERLRQPEPESARQTEPADENPWPLLEMSLLPATYQLLYRASRIDAKPVDTAKAARRESVLNARGMRTKTFDNPPEPAQWVHSPQQLASDAFKP